MSFCRNGGGLVFIETDVLAIDGTIDADGGTVQTADGAQITFLPAGMRGPIWVKVEAVNRNSFANETANNHLVAAAKSLPADLTVASPLYLIQHRGENSPQAIIFTIPIPDDVESYQTLDFYTWNGSTWEWQPNRKLPVKEMVEAELDFLPGAAAVMETSPRQPEVAADVHLKTGLPADAAETLTEINLQGFLVYKYGIVFTYQLIAVITQQCFDAVVYKAEMTVLVEYVYDIG